jgi:hypothetical protein
MGSACSHRRLKTVQAVTSTLDTEALNHANPGLHLGEHGIKQGLLRGREATQHVAHRAGTSLSRILRRSADADPQPRKVLGAEVTDRAAQAVVAAGTARSPQTQATEGQVHVVNNHQQLRGFEPNQSSAARIARPLSFMKVWGLSSRSLDGPWPTSAMRP